MDVPHLRQLLNPIPPSSGTSLPADVVTRRHIVAMSSKPRSRRSTRKDPWDENVLMTSSKSKLIDLDLVVGGIALTACLC